MHTAVRREPGLIDHLLSLLYPERCLFCRALLKINSLVPLCPACEPAFMLTGSLCPACNQALMPGESCPCRQQSSLSSLFALTTYDQRWRPLLHNLKYRKKLSLARPMGRWLGDELRSHPIIVPAPSAIVPLPLHHSREKERGYNQSALLAKQVASVLKVPCLVLLQRTKATLSQTKISRFARQANIRGAFSCPAAPPAGTAVLLIDDIYSTGATMQEAAAVLVRQGVIVHGAVVAFNPRLT